MNQSPQVAVFLVVVRLEMFATDILLQTPYELPAKSNQAWVSSRECTAKVLKGVVIKP